MERRVPRKSFVRRRDHLVDIAEAEVPPVGKLPPAAELGAMTRFLPLRDADWRRDARDAWRRAIHAAEAWTAA